MTDLRGRVRLLIGVDVLYSPFLRELESHFDPLSLLFLLFIPGLSQPTSSGRQVPLKPFPRPDSPSVFTLNSKTNQTANGPCQSLWIDQGRSAGMCQFGTNKIGRVVHGECFGPRMLTLLSRGCQYGGGV